MDFSNKCTIYLEILAFYPWYNVEVLTLVYLSPYVMKKLKAKSFIIDGKAESQKRKFYHTALQLYNQAGN